MSVQLINKYYNKVQKLQRYSGTTKETSIRSAFMELIDVYAEQKDLLLVPELDYKTTDNKTIFPDGTLKDSLRLAFGYYEGKDINDDIKSAIDLKFKKGYPNSNILFENSQTAILYQQGKIVEECKILDAEKLNDLLNAFVSYTRPEIITFRKALEQFKDDLPYVLTALRDMIDQQVLINSDFVLARKEFLELCRSTINSNVSNDDVNEMLIQHILTEEIFNTIFDDPQFHQENNISQELQKLERTFFTGAVKRNTLDRIKQYYLIIKAQASNIPNHTEKQKFLKVIYEHFYRAYNPEGSKKLGIVYTPDEIVKFIIESTDYILHKKFNKILASNNVEILDPATGTGTFICDLIDYLPTENLQNKFINEIHANEVAILPYYISNLNIEATFKQKMGYYQEFKNICFVDTLDNIGGLRYSKKQKAMFSFSAVNAERINKQNTKKISVIIGNPPYFANQKNENDNNKAKKYPQIDKRISETYIKHSGAQKTKQYDLYKRFLRWASDRVEENGIIAFITNRAFLHSHQDKGFRYCIKQEFNYSYFLDLGGDIRSDKADIVDGNVFPIKTGVAICFLIKKEKSGDNDIYYHSIAEGLTGKQKLEYLRESIFSKIPFKLILPDANNNWINVSENSFGELIPMISKAFKNKATGSNALFNLYCYGNSSNRDEWVYDIDRVNLGNKMKYFTNTYNALKESRDFSFKKTLKWSRDLKLKIKKSNTPPIVYNDNKITTAAWRPFHNLFLYSEKTFNDVLTSNHFDMFGKGLDKPNRVIMLINHPQIEFSVFALNILADAGFSGRATIMIPLYRYTETGNKINNITEWGKDKFIKYYRDDKISSEDIFYYTYAVLSFPEYRETYKLNLKREFPSIPYYDDFYKWVKWGKALMNCHLNYETEKPYNLKLITTQKSKNKATTQGKLLDVKPINKQLQDTKTLEFKTNKAKLKADKKSGIIEIDQVSRLEGIPPEAWTFKLGNKSALEWVLDQYKAKKKKDKVIAQSYNPYQFSDYKDHVIDLLKRVCTVSMETMKIIDEMKA